MPDTHPFRDAAPLPGPQQTGQKFSTTDCAGKGKLTDQTTRDFRHQQPGGLDAAAGVGEPVTNSPDLGAGWTVQGSAGSGPQEGA